MRHWGTALQRRQPTGAIRRMLGQQPTVLDQVLEQLQEPAEVRGQKHGLPHILTLSLHTGIARSPKPSPTHPHCHPSPPPYTLLLQPSCNRHTTSFWVKAGLPTSKKRLQHQLGQLAASQVQNWVRKAKPAPNPTLNQRVHGRSHLPARCCYACVTSSHSWSRSGCSCTGLTTAAGGRLRSLKSAPSATAPTCCMKQAKRKT